MEIYRSSQSHRGQGNSGRSEQKTGIEHILDYTNLCSFGNTLMSPCDVCSVTDIVVVFKIMVFSDEGDVIFSLEEDYLMLLGRC
jgi:hypothetical protein